MSVGGGRGVTKGARSRGSILGLLHGIAGYTLVAHLGHVAAGSVHGVGDQLGPSVRQQHAVGTSGQLIVALLLLIRRSIEQYLIEV